MSWNKKYKIHVSPRPPESLISHQTATGSKVISTGLTQIDTDTTAGHDTCDAVF